MNFKTANNNTYEKSHKVPHGEELTDKIQDEIITIADKVLIGWLALTCFGIHVARLIMSFWFHKYAPKVYQNMNIIIKTFIFYSVYIYMDDILVSYN